MIKLERNKAIEGAIKRAAHNHNFVTMIGVSQYLVGNLQRLQKELQRVPKGRGRQRQ